MNDHDNMITIIVVICSMESGAQSGVLCSLGVPRNRIFATGISPRKYRPGIPSTILYYHSRKYARINIDVYAAELSFLKTPDTPRPESTGADISRVTMPGNAWD